MQKRADSRYELGDIVPVEIKSKEFGRIATQNAKKKRHSSEDP